LARRVVSTLFDCGHRTDVTVSLDTDVTVPELVRGLGQCPACMSEGRLVAISGVAPQRGGRQLVLDSILMMPVDG
jgi:hypothetical protein